MVKNRLIGTLLFVVPFIAQAMPPASNDAIPPGHPPMPGHPTAGASKGGTKMPPPVDPRHLPNQGTVLKILPSNSYVYVQVDHKGDKQWLAAVRFPVEVGDTVRYGNGNRMVDFYSKSQQMTFPEVLFVSRIARVE